MSDRVVVRIAQLAPALGDVPTNLERMLSAARDAAANGVDLLVFPELALTGYALRDHVPEVAIPLDSPEMNALREASRGVSIAFGFVEETPDHRFFNSAAYLEHGEIVHVHRKVHLPTYGLFEEGRYFASGESVRAFETRFGRFAMLVCEDVWHLPIPYLAALDGAIALLVLSAGPTRGLDHEGHAKSSSAWERLLLTYASSLTMYVVYANRVGFDDGVEFWGGSEIVDPAGTVALKGRYHDPDQPTAPIDLDLVRRERIQTPLLRDERLPLVIAELARIQEKRRETLPGLSAEDRQRTESSAEERE
ncbi:MAG: carbon-nitrogen hydrolase [Gemmatimonadetes bacterium]|nr:carbon-nitrogen hydrolase [Gemmatimonadota bacterium]